MSRLMKSLLLLLLLLPMTAEAEDLAQLLRRFERHAAAKELSAAEAVAREAVTRFPSSRDARLALANALLWRGRYAEAEKRYREILAGRHEDLDARLGLARALYWSGDLRGAEREYGRIAGHPEAARSLGEIRSTAAPSMRLDSLYRSDSQPLETVRVEAAGSVFSDPLTRWDGAVGTYRFDGAGVTAAAPFIRGGVETALPRLRTTLRATATLLRFPDEQTKPLGLIAVDRKLGASTLSLTAARNELFGSARSLDTHAYSDSLELRWSHARASARVESLRYFDQNRGLAADGWLMVPAGPFSVGATVAFRDTEESRFVAEGVYDPYWTPIELREVRLVATGSRRFGRTTAAIHVDAGIADEEVNGRYQPWRAAMSLAIPIESFTLNVEAGRQSTVFYTANEIRASLARRF